MTRSNSVTIQTAILAATFILSVILSTPTRAEDKNFQKWIADFYPIASKNGIKQSIYNRVFNNITSPDTEVLRKAKYQPEFTQKIWDYLDARVNTLTITNGLNKAQQHAQTLASIEKQFGINQSILLAIWSIESNYGSALNDMQRLHFVPHALASLAYADKKRKKFAHSQLIAALKILQSGDIAIDQMKGSWAGAMGHTQFIPTSYLAYAVDMDHDGKRDIWNSIPDALATAANLLKKNNWQTDETWGYEVQLPVNGSRYQGQTKTFSEWEKLGFLKADRQPFSYSNKKATLKLLSGAHRPAFLLMKNFFVIKRYNNSDFYALTVGLLANRISGHSDLIQAWPRPAHSLSSDEKFELQTLLNKLGYYSGEIDGQIGTASREAIQAFQNKEGLPADGIPSQSLLKVLRAVH